MRRAPALTAHVGLDGPRDNAPTPSRHGRAWISTTESRTSRAPAAWGRLRYIWTHPNQYGLIVASQTRRCRLTSQIRLFVEPVQPVKGPVFGEGQRRGPPSSYLFSGIIIIVAFPALAARELLLHERRYAVGRTSGFLRTDTDSCNSMKMKEMKAAVSSVVSVPKFLLPLLHGRVQAMPIPNRSL